VAHIVRVNWTLNLRDKIKRLKLLGLWLLVPGEESRRCYWRSLRSICGKYETPQAAGAMSARPLGGVVSEGVFS